MNGYIVTTFVLVALANLAKAEPAPLFFAPAAAIAIPAGATAAQTASITAANAAAVSTAATANFFTGGVILLKALVVGGLLLHHARNNRRGRRSAADEADAAFSVLLNAEPAQCYHRLICDLAAGAIPDNNKIMSLFNNEEVVSPISPKFEFLTAAKVGKMVKSAATCEVRYSCPLSTLEIQKITA